jgi:capsular polysaccharide biosynthesis protein
MSKAMNEEAGRSAAAADMKTPTERVQSFWIALRRRWPAALTVFVLTLATAAAVTAAQHKKYDATAQILLQPTDRVQAAINPGSVPSPADAERDVNTYTQMITVDPVASAVRSQLGLHTTLPALINMISVSGENTSNLVSITAQSTSPVQAARLASAFATQYQIYRRQNAVQQIDQAQAAAEADAQSKTPGSPAAQRVQQLQAASASETGGVQIVRPANVPGSPASPKVMTNMAVGLFVALMLSVATVFGLEAVDRRLLGPAQFQEALGAPVLGVIPGGRWTHRYPARAQVARRRAYTDVAARLAFTGVTNGSRAIMVSPANEGSAAGAVALALTEALCVVGRHVILIEADLGSRPALRAGGADERGGLTSVLTGRSNFMREVTDVHFVAGSGPHRRELEPWALVSYSTLPSGPRVAEPEALLGRAAMRDVLDEARERGDLVLVLTGPLSRPSGVLPLARLCDGAIVLAETSMRVDQAEQTAQLLASTGTRLLGTVLIEPDSAEQTTSSEQLMTGPARQAEPVNSNGNGEHTDAGAANPKKQLRGG